MKFTEVKKCLDKNASYFWQNRGDRFALVNAYTLKTVTGVPHRLDAVKMTESLSAMGYKVAELEEMPS